MNISPLDPPNIPEPRCDAARLHMAAEWLQRLSNESTHDKLIDEWINWSADPANPAAFERLNAIRQAAVSTHYRSLPDQSLSDISVAAVISTNYELWLRRILLYCHDRQLSRELLQDAVYATWKRWRAGQLKGLEQIPEYVFRVAMNSLKTYCRVAATQKHRIEAGELEELSGDREPGISVMEQEILTQLRNTICKMQSPVERELVDRFYLQDKDRDTICRDMGLSPLRFSTILSRARKRLFRLLESHGLRDLL